MSSYEENLQTLINKVDGVSDSTWEEVCDEIGINCHPDSLRKAFSVTDYSGYNVAKYFMNKTTKELTDDMLAKLQEKKDDEYKERIRLQDARREYNKELRAEARYENLCEILQKTLDGIDWNDEYSFGEKHLHIEDKKPKHAILMLSDWHYGALCDSQWNYYDTEVAELRAYHLVNKVKKWILSLGITDLTIEINGDMVEGLISVSGRVSAEESVVEQIVHVSKLLARSIRSLKPYVNSIQVVTTLGNHGRLVPDKKQQAYEHENFEMLIPEFLSMALYDDIPVISSHGLDFVKYECDGKTICLCHGHHDKVSSAIENMVKIYKVVPDEIHLGHYHHMSDLNESNIHVVVNGSLKGTDDFGLKAARATTKPSQNLIVYGEDRLMIEIVVD